ncbi:rRNA maturation RNase YbeY [Jeotgalibaca sp. MA1X17-3]|uniref:rRNA maturation RNase YbeY n=1 Tax=Jeotgalibaca sp. MA1X17-3 TaxID=2908211 RepID=UPI001F3FC901|nr:rRNA maturation RNase YbeY [Jeotgalibaca sp. MA1X17-3]UJF16673.1 rRNA maturation RNase YbeY [Jeotgalibaca sp. MA1X17-3]
MEIDFFDETNVVQTKEKELVIKLLTFASQHLQLQEHAEMSVTIVTNERIQEINSEYRNKNVATDVISFALNDDSEDDFPINLESMGEDFPFNLGDIIISQEKTAEQAILYGHSFERELGFLALHGFLHLNGYDHMNPEDEKEMFDLQKEILDAYGLKRE